MYSDGNRDEVTNLNKFLSEVIEQRIARTCEALKKNNMVAYVVNTPAEAREQVKTLLNDGDVIGVGGSATLDECDILSLLREERYDFIDRYKPGLSREEMQKLYISALGSDVFITSSNAVTEDGCLYNVDGNGNRVAAIAYGPKSVIVVVGYNKIVKTLDDAVKRVKTFASPANNKRLSCQSYCRETGECLAVAQGSSVMTDGCSAEGRICCQYLVSAQQRIKDRIKVIIVKEELGF